MGGHSFLVYRLAILDGIATAFSAKGGAVLDVRIALGLLCDGVISA